MGRGEPTSHDRIPASQRRRLHLRPMGTAGVEGDSGYADHLRILFLRSHRAEAGDLQLLLPYRRRAHLDAGGHERVFREEAFAIEGCLGSDGQVRQRACELKRGGDVVFPVWRRADQHGEWTGEIWTYTRD